MTFKGQKPGEATRAFGVVAILSLPCFPSLVCGQCQYDVIEFHAPPLGGEIASPTTPSAISENGQYVVGSYKLGGFGSVRAFVYLVATNEFLTIPPPPGTFGWSAFDVTDDGLVAGYYGNSNGDFGFLFDIKSWQYVAELASDAKDGYCHTAGLNSSGIVCGERSLDDGGDPTTPKTAFLWQNGVFTDLGLIEGEGTSGKDVNEAGWIVGQMGQGGTARGFIWDGEQIVDLGQLTPGMETTPNTINGVNSAGGAGLVPFVGSPNYRPHAFVWQNGEMTDLGTLPGHDGSSVSGLNDFGVAVGALRLVFQDNSARGTIWLDGVISNLNDLVLDKMVQVAGVRQITNSGWLLAIGDDFEPFVPNVGFVLIPNSVAGDVDVDCHVDVDDLFAVIGEWSKTDSVADVNQDAIVDVLDLMLVIEAWTG